MFAGGCECRVAEARERHLDNRLGRGLAVLRRIECPLDVVLVGRDNQAIAELVFRNSLDRGQAVQRKVKFRGIAAHADIVNPAREAGFHMACTDEFQDRAFRIGVRDHGQAFEALSPRRLDPCDPPVLDDDALYRHVGTNGDAGPACRVRQFFCERPHAACRHGQPAVACRETIQVGHYRVGRARPEMGPEYGIEAQRTTEQRVFESLGDLVMDIDADQPQEGAHLRPAEPAQIESQPCERRKVPEVAGPEPRRCRIEVGIEQVRETRHLPVKRPVRSDVGVGDTFNHIARVAYVLSIRRQRDSLHCLARQFR